MDDPWLLEQYNAHSDHNVADDQGSLKLQQIPDVGFQNEQIAPTVYVNAWEYNNLLDTIII